MTVQADIEVYGLRDALKVLRDLDPEARKAAVKKIKSAGGELAAIGRENYPGFVPLRGWSKGGRLGYDPGRVAAGVQVQVGGRTPKGADFFPLVTLVQRNAGGALYDLAGLRGGTKPGRLRGPNPAFLEALNGKYGTAQRGMWRSVRRIRERSYGAMLSAIKEVAAEAGRKLV